MGKRLGEFVRWIQAALGQYVHNRGVELVTRFGTSGLDEDATPCVMVEQDSSCEAATGVVDAEEQDNGPAHGRSDARGLLGCSGACDLGRYDDDGSSGLRWCGYRTSAAWSAESPG